MTHEEAISILTKDRALCLFNPLTGDVGPLNEDCRMSAEAMNLAIEALEKQIPKKPLHMHKNYYCPICKEDGWMLWDDAIPNDMDEYCGKCGQAIDWEVSE